MCAPETNLLLESLSPESRHAILAHSKHLYLSLRTSLQAQEEQPRFAYFMTTGVASVVVGHLEGASSETALIGHEGLTGALSLLGTAVPTAECFIQIPGNAYQVPFGAVQELFAKSSEIRTRILQSIQQQAMTTMQIAACNAAHEAEPRLARWLLMVQDRTQADTFYITQEFLGQMLGSRRTTLALAAGVLQRSGFIEYSRGKVKILSREALRTAACECYDVTERLLSNLFRQSSVELTA